MQSSRSPEPASSLKTEKILVCLALYPASRYAWLCALALVIASVATAAHAQGTDIDGVHIELPANGQLRVENQFGDITVNVGNVRDVVVVADVEGATESRLPILIETKETFRSVTVVRSDADSRAQINLTLKIPESTRVEIVTGKGKIVTRGLSAAMVLQTVSGNISSELGSPLDADVLAVSTTGSVRSDVAAVGSDSHSYHSRFGPGRKSLRITSAHGDVVLSTQPAIVSGSAGPSRAPELQASNGTPAAGTPATRNASEEVDEGDVIRVDAQLVTLNLSVVDQGTNKGVAGLTKSDFRLFEDNVEQELLQFDSSSAPFDLILLIDVSGSTRDVVKLIRAAAQRFVDAARPSDRIAIITFAGQATMVSPLTLDREVLRERVKSIDTLSGDTKLYDAGAFALAEAAKQTKNPRRTAIVLMSDGLDGSIPGVQGDGSKLGYKDFLNEVREFDGVLYTLWLNTYYEALNAQDTQPEAFDTGYERMKELADAGGGMFYEVESLDDLAGSYERVVSDLGTVYSLAYRPIDSTRNGKWRAIKVNVKPRHAIARGKHGYYAN